MQHIQSWSGGKDSTASIILEHIHGLPRSTIIFSEVMFDKKRGISGELPEHMEWVHNTAIPLFESWGHEVKILHSDKDYLDLFFHTVTRSKHLERVGKYAGFPLGGMCHINRELKLRPINQFYNGIKGDFTQFIGVASDEPERLKRLKGTNKISLLDRYGYTEKMAFDLCAEYSLVSPIYNHSKRGGCWFCPNNPIRAFAYIKQSYPQLWEELEKLSHTENLVSYYFRYDKTFAQVDSEVDSILSLFDFNQRQLTLFDD